MVKSSLLINKYAGMNIHQLSITYQPDHDRILLQVNTQAKELLRVWLTRRMLLQFLPRLNHLAHQAVASKIDLMTANESTRQMLMEFKRQESVAQGDFKTPFDAQAKTWPLGQEPLLASTIHLQPKPGGVIQLGFEEKAGQPPRGFQINLDTALLHNVIHLLEAAVQASGWGLSAALTGSGSHEATADTLPSTPPQYLN